MSSLPSSRSQAQRDDRQRIDDAVGPDESLIEVRDALTRLPRQYPVTYSRSSVSLAAMPARLAVDYGSGYTKAALGWPDGSWTLLGFDGGFLLSNAVHVASGTVAVGVEAWRFAETDPDGFVAAPLRADTDQVTVGGVAIEVSDLVAAALRRVAAEAVRVGGEPVRDVRMVVPAGWGPRRRTWLRRAAGKAGLGQPRLIEAPVAAMTPILAREAGPAPVVALVVDVGAGCEASVLRRDPAGGVEVLSTLADAASGGDQIETALIEAATGRAADAWPAEQWWPLLSSARAAKQALAGQPAVTMPLPDGTPPVVVNSLLLRQAAQPVLERVGKMAAEAVGNADLWHLARTSADIARTSELVPAPRHGCSWPYQPVLQVLTSGTTATGSSASASRTARSPHRTRSMSPNGFRAVHHAVLGRVEHRGTSVWAERSCCRPTRWRCSWPSGTSTSLGEGRTDWIGLPSSTNGCRMFRGDGTVEVGSVAVQQEAHAWPRRGNPASSLPRRQGSDSIG